MPGGDRTGPVGRGPVTGRGAGFCAGYGMPGFSNLGHGTDAAVYRGRDGRGRGRRNRFFATGVPGWQYFSGNTIPGEMSFSTQSETPQNELDVLKGQARYLQNGLKELQARMEALSSRSKTE
jgi:hypothetical protein